MFNRSFLSMLVAFALGAVLASCSGLPSDVSNADGSPVFEDKKAGVFLGVGPGAGGSISIVCLNKKDETYAKGPACHKLFNAKSCKYWGVPEYSDMSCPTIAKK
tara:strand:- start:18771 stop:19082 length:312 start_codon:yes stop_codon:yes gene_type:complete